MPSYLDSLPLLLYEYKVHVIIIFFFYQLDFQQFWGILGGDKSY